jgi:hypothetical protein
MSQSFVSKAYALSQIVAAKEYTNAGAGKGEPEAFGEQSNPCSISSGQYDSWSG